jgi:membrane fusion protein (multidrug efflux system)
VAQTGGGKAFAPAVQGEEGMMFYNRDEWKKERKETSMRERVVSQSLVRGQVNKFTVAAGLLVVGLTLVGCGPRAPQGPQGAMGPPEVGVVELKAQRVVLTTELPGRTTAYRVADIRPQVNGLILKRAFTEGAEVKKGDLLYQIDPAPYQAAVDQAQAAVAMAEAQLPAVLAREERFRSLVESRAVGQQAYDDALAALRQLEGQLGVSKAALEMAKINLSYTPIKAPISGRIGRSGITEGALVTAYQPIPLATIQQLDPIYVDVAQSTAELQTLQRRLADGRLTRDGENQNMVTILREDGTAYPQDGALEFRDVTVDPTTGSVILRIVVPNPDGELLPGMFVRAVVKEGVKEDAILVPQQGVSRDPKGNPLALIVNADGNVEQRMLALDRAIGHQWLVCSGLAAGDRVIVEGVQKVRPGAPAMAVPFNSDRFSPEKATAPMGN